MEGRCPPTSDRATENLGLTSPRLEGRSTEAEAGVAGEAAGEAAGKNVGKIGISPPHLAAAPTSAKTVGSFDAPFCGSV